MEKSWVALASSLNPQTPFRLALSDKAWRPRMHNATNSVRFMSQAVIGRPQPQGIRGGGHSVRVQLAVREINLALFANRRKTMTSLNSVFDAAITSRHQIRPPSYLASAAGAVRGAVIDDHPESLHIPSEQNSTRRD